MGTRDEGWGKVEGGGGTDTRREKEVLPGKRTSDQWERTYREWVRGEEKGQRTLGRGGIEKFCQENAKGRERIIMM